MIDVCIFCKKSLNSQILEKQYLAAGWKEKYPNQPEPNEFIYRRCDICYNKFDKYFAASYIADCLWTIAIATDNIDIINNYIKDSCQIKTYSKLTQDWKSITINSVLTLDLTDLDKIIESATSYVIFS